MTHARAGEADDRRMPVLAQRQTGWQMRTDAVRRMAEIDVTDKSEVFGRNASTVEKISIKNTNQSKTGRDNS